MKLMEFFVRRKDNPGTVISTLLKKLNIKVNDSSIETCLKDHPDYPSLLSLSDCLTSWKISNSSFRLNKSEYNSRELEYPFIAHLNEQAGKFIFFVAPAQRHIKPWING